MCEESAMKKKSFETRTRITYLVLQEQCYINIVLHQLRFIKYCIELHRQDKNLF